MKPFLAVLLLVPSILSAPAAKAGPLLGGTFSTTFASGDFETAHGDVDVTGTGVTGSLTLSSVAGAFTPSGLPSGSYLLKPGAVDLSFDILALGEMVDFSTAHTGEDSFIQLTDTGSMQQVLLAPAFVDPHLITELSLTGPEGSLFKNINDPKSLHAGLGVSLASGAFLSVFQQGGGILNGADVAFGGTAVDEPPSWALLGLSLISLLALHLRFGRPAIRRSGATTVPRDRSLVRLAA